MSKRRHTDEEIFVACESVRTPEQPASVRRVYALVGGSWPRIARLVAAFNRQHDPLAHMTGAYEDAVYQVQELTIEISRLRHQLNENMELVEEYKAKLAESSDSAGWLLQAAIDQ